MRKKLAADFNRGDSLTRGWVLVFACRLLCALVLWACLSSCAPLSPAGGCRAWRPRGGGRGVVRGAAWLRRFDWPAAKACYYFF